MGGLGVPVFGEVGGDGSGAELGGQCLGDVRVVQPFLWGFSSVATVICI